MFTYLPLQANKCYVLLGSFIFLLTMEISNLATSLNCRDNNYFNNFNLKSWSVRISIKYWSILTYYIYIKAKKSAEVYFRYLDLRQFSRDQCLVNFRFLKMIKSSRKDWKGKGKTSEHNNLGTFAAMEDHPFVNSRSFCVLWIDLQF